MWPWGMCWGALGEAGFLHIHMHIPIHTTGCSSMSLSFMTPSFPLLSLWLPSVGCARSPPRLNHTQDPQDNVLKEGFMPALQCCAIPALQCCAMQAIAQLHRYIIMTTAWHWGIMHAVGPSDCAYRAASMLIVFIAELPVQDIQVANHMFLAGPLGDHTGPVLEAPLGTNLHTCKYCRPSAYLRGEPLTKTPVHCKLSAVQCECCSLEGIRPLRAQANAGGCIPGLLVCATDSEQHRCF